jgi:hypothetical protein
MLNETLITIQHPKFNIQHFVGMLSLQNGRERA